MVTSALTITGMNFSLPAIEAFPTSLSVLNLAGLDGRLDSNTTKQLRSLENRFLENVHVEGILRARSDKALNGAIAQSYEVAFLYYVESAILVWRALNHDYEKLLHLSRTSSSALEKVFFKHHRELEPPIFVDSVAGLRVLSKVAEWTILGEQGKNAGVPPLDYLGKVSIATFLTWVMLAHITGQVSRARKHNVRLISEGIKQIAQEIYQKALTDRLPAAIGEEQEWFWSVEWQEGEVEADLDKYLNKVKTFSSANSLIQDLNQS